MRTASANDMSKPKEAPVFRTSTAPPQVAGGLFDGSKSAPGAASSGPKKESEKKQDDYNRKILESVQEFKSAVLASIEASGKKLNTAMEVKAVQPSLPDDWLSAETEEMKSNRASLTQSCDSLYTSTQRLHADIGIAEAAAMASDRGAKTGMLERVDEKLQVW